MSYTPTSPAELITFCKGLLNANVFVRTWVLTITTEEFPYVTTIDTTSGDAGFPAIHVNIDSVEEDLENAPGLGLVAREARFSVYVSMSDNELSDLEAVLWSRIENVRAALIAERSWGNRLFLPITTVSVSSIPIPGLGQNYSGARVLRFSTYFTELFVP